MRLLQFERNAVKKQLPNINKAVLLLFTLTLTSCGYHTATKGGSQIPNLNTLAVPPFINQTSTYKVEQTLASAVVKELLKRTNYQLLYREDSAADATHRSSDRRVRMLSSRRRMGEHSI